MGTKTTRHLLVGMMALGAGAPACKEQPKPAGESAAKAPKATQWQAVEREPETAAEPRGKYIFLEQGLSHEKRATLWYTPQGSLILPYDWFLHLEQPSGTELIRSEAHMDALRFINSDKSKANPDGLPVGLAKSRYRGEEWMGVTCAACHTARIDYQGKQMIVDGGPTLTNFQAFMTSVITGLRTTLNDPAKRKRFEDNVLGKSADKAARKKLEGEIAQVLELRVQHNEMNASPHPYGHGRLDAFGMIFNSLTSQFLRDKDGKPLTVNRRVADAPVSLPFLWGTPQLNLVQWNGIAQNRGPGPLLRNIGEVFGTMGRLDIGKDSFDSSVELEGLGKLEGLLVDLKPPPWPEHILGAVDRDKAARGKKHYDELCVGCHEVVDGNDPKRELKAVMVPVDEIGTDPKMADNAAGRTAKTGVLEGRRHFVVAGKKLGPTEPAVTLLVYATMRVALDHPVDAVKATVEGYAKVYDPSKFNPRAYKARSLSGIWATAPYLHNGSVPNLYQLLLPPQARVGRFYVGSREFDPKNVGYVHTKSPGATELDTTLEGNRNIGHNHAPELDDTQRHELIEYLKIVGT